MTTASTLAERAFDIVVRDLEGFGNRLNEQHRQALRRMLETYSSMACGEITGRFAFDLPTGCGKTQSVIAWCQAVHEIKSGHSVVIATSKVEELCDIKRKLIAKGVPEECVGLIHSKLYDEERAKEWKRKRDPSVLIGNGGEREYASLPRTTENEKRQFLLVTHSRVQSRRRNLDLLNTFEGKPRNLVFWDESLLSAQAEAISKREIESALDWLIRWPQGAAKKQNGSHPAAHVPSPGSPLWSAFKIQLKASLVVVRPSAAVKAPRRDRPDRQISLDADRPDRAPRSRTGRLKATRHDAPPDPTHVGPLRAGKYGWPPKIIE